LLAEEEGEPSGELRLGEDVGPRPRPQLLDLLGEAIRLDEASELPGRELPRARHGTVEAALAAEEGAQPVALDAASLLFELVAPQQRLEARGADRPTGFRPGEVHAVGESAEVAVGVTDELEQDVGAFRRLELLDGALGRPPGDEAAEERCGAAAPGARRSPGLRGRSLAGRCLGFGP